MAKAIVGNIYKHFKGNEYEVISIAVDTETLRERVIYKSITDGKLWDREKEEWEGYKGENIERFIDITKTVK